MRITAIIQARMGSTRLPGKVLKPFGAWPVLEHVLCRVAMAVPDICVAIPKTPENDALETWLATEGRGAVQASTALATYKGPEEDVLARYWGAALSSGADYVVRVTADCPLVQPEDILRTVAQSVAYQAYARTPFTFARGLEVEAFPIRLLAEAHQRAIDPADREHVCPWMARHAGVIHVPARRQRWTLDTEEDYAWFCRLAQHVSTEPPHPTTQEVLDYIATTGDVLYEPEA